MVVHVVSAPVLVAAPPQAGQAARVAGAGVAGGEAAGGGVPAPRHHHLRLQGDGAGVPAHRDM